jgi:hypothetical protein
LEVTVGVARVLSAADELSAVAFDELGLVESQFRRPRPRVDRCTFHSSFLAVVSPLLSRSDSVDQIHPPVVGPLNLPQLKPTTSPRRREERLPFSGDQRMNS